MNSWNDTCRLEQLADDFESIGDYESAESHLRQCIAMRRLMMDRYDKRLIDPLYNLGLLCWAQDNTLEAMRCMKEAINISDRTYGIANRESQEIKELMVFLAEESEVTRSFDFDTVA